MVIDFNDTAIQLFIILGGTIIPLLTNLLTKTDASPRVKSVLTLILVTAGALITQILAAPDGFDLEQWLWTAVPTFIVSMAALFGIYMPLGIHEKTKQLGVR